MNKTIYTAILALAPVSLAAQPVINSVEDYYQNTSVKYVNCIASVGAGASGANQHWQFTALSAIDTVTDDLITQDWAPHRTQHPDANLVRRTRDGDYIYYNKTNNATYIVGTHDEPAGLHLTHANSILSSKRPLKFGDVAVDTFSSSETSTNSTGMGTVDLSVDGWGMLHLPGNQVYNNVIRVKVVMNSMDIVPVAPPPYPSPSTITTYSTLYAWYSNDHPSALLRWDSTSVVINGGTPTGNKSLAYFLEEHPYSIDELEPAVAAPVAHISDQKVTIAADFKAERTYEASIFNLSGQKIQEFRFNAAGDRKELVLDKPIVPGTYIILLTDNTRAMPYIIKTISQ